LPTFRDISTRKLYFHEDTILVGYEVTPSMLATLGLGTAPV
jgi:hypothetical protein